ncbi:unnamed protein product [Fraxinus pennsylvanica]|uniref:Uncharacterized protein n=1 Tax=Fraxinus pennsylvanica TaxID=56036 RepID=A0AAD2A2F3_9LAMI|nr:unnamed protein product [Fraxinus pennsylvanica]
MNCCSDPVRFVTRRICGLADSEMVKDSRLDTCAYNDVLNACANLGAPRIFCNCLTKCQNLDAMSERKKDICRILRELNFEDRYEDGASRKLGNESEVFEKLLPNSIDPNNNEPPELPEGIAPYSRIYTTLTKVLGRSLSSMRCDKEVLLLLKSSYTTLMKAFALSGHPKLANKFFDEVLNDPWRMKDTDFYPNVATYGSLANGIAFAIKQGEALLLWNEIKERCGMEKE